MPEYQVLSRKYRPQRFADVIGQEPVVTTIRNAVAQNRIAHAYLFCGSRGTGKTTLARLFAKAINCQALTAEGEPCNACPACKEIASGSALDVLEIDGASHRGIEDIRQINEGVGYSPSVGKYKVLILDEVHMLTKEAFNALLKTLEEPPPKVKFFMATTEAHKLPMTILSRCQRFQLNRISEERIFEKLQQICRHLQIEADPAALQLIASFSEGSLRDAELLLDQVITFHSTITLSGVEQALSLLPREEFFTLDEAVKNSDYKKAVGFADIIFASGKNLSYFFEELIAHYRTLLRLKMGISPLLPSSLKERYIMTAAAYKEEQLLAILTLLAEGSNKIKSSLSQRFILEMALLQIVHIPKKISPETLVEKLAALENRLLSSSEKIEKKEEAQETEASRLQRQAREETLIRFAANAFEGSAKVQPNNKR